MFRPKLSGKIVGSCTAYKVTQIGFDAFLIRPLEFLHVVKGTWRTLRANPTAQPSESPLGQNPKRVLYANNVPKLPGSANMLSPRSSGGQKDSHLAFLLVGFITPVFHIGPVGPMPYIRRRRRDHLTCVTFLLQRFLECVFATVGGGSFWSDKVAQTCLFWEPHAVGRFL